MTRPESLKSALFFTVKFSVSVSGVNFPWLHFGVESDMRKRERERDREKKEEYYRESISNGIPEISSSCFPLAFKILSNDESPSI